MKEEHAAQKKAAAAARFKAAQEDSDDESTSVESEKEPIVLLQEVREPCELKEEVLTLYTYILSCISYYIFNIIIYI